jgi:hypothetical protein
METIENVIEGITLNIRSIASSLFTDLPTSGIPHENWTQITAKLLVFFFSLCLDFSCYLKIYQEG